jgi:hypothetical protein
MIRTLSQTEAARRDTIFTRADGYALDELSIELLGLARPATYPRDAWARMLLALVYRPRGTFRTLFAVLDALFEPWSRLTALNVTVTASGGVTDATITNAYGSRWGRFVDAESGEQTLVFVTTATTGSLQLATYGSSYFEAWSGEERPGTLTLLPFTLSESRCLVTMLLDAELLSAPPSYLQSPDGSARPSSQPLGGVLLNLFDLDPDTLDYGDQVRGPYPLYLTGDEVDGVIGHVMRCLLPAGVRLEVRSVDFGGQLGYGPIYSLPRFGRVGPANLGS